jgi:GT2 family glycosyltransferase
VIREEKRSCNWGRKSHGSSSEQFCGLNKTFNLANKRLRAYIGADGKLHTRLCVPINKGENIFQMLTLLQALRPLIRFIEKQDRKLQVAQDSATLPPVESFNKRRPQDHFPAASYHRTIL